VQNTITFELKIYAVDAGLAATNRFSRTKDSQLFKECTKHSFLLGGKVGINQRLHEVFGVNQILRFK